jgi:hypothetical protein
MQIGGESIENLLINMVLEKIKLEKKKTQKNTFMCLFILEWDKQILNWNLVG